MESSNGGFDMISKLPDDILQSILSRLQSTEEAIRTSILSTRWRYQWTSVPSIDIDYARALKPSQEFDINGFKEFVDWVLLNKPSLQHLDTFRLRCYKYYNINMSTISQWIHEAVTRKVKQLDLMFEPRVWSREGIELPQCLVTCSSLEALRLCGNCWSLCLPKFTGFLALRILELNEVQLDGDYYNVLKYFLENCPLLEDLSLIDYLSYEIVVSCPKLKNLRIHSPTYYYDRLVLCCPKLEFLILTGCVAFKFFFRNLYSLKKVVLYPTHTLKAISDVFSGISHVEYLSVNITSIYELCEDPKVISLPNLKTLEITVSDFHMEVVIMLFRYLPDLDSLNLIFPEELFWYAIWKLDDADTMRVLTRHLKRVEFLGFDEGPQEDEDVSKLDIARALLEHGNLLEEMVFSWSDEDKFNDRSMELSNCHKASSNVKLTHRYIQPN